MAVDPVCKMQVDEKKTQFKSQHTGKSYFFCSSNCKKSFDSDPHKYLGAHAH